MANVDHYDVGDLVVRTATFKVGEAPGVVTDPATVTAKTLSPAGTISTYVYGTNAELTKVSTGLYKLTVPATSAGSWTYQFIGTGAASGVQTGEYVVDPDPFTGSLVADYALTTVSVAELYLNRMGQGGSLGAEREDRAWIASLINQASTAIHRYTRREFKPKTPASDADPVVTRRFRYDGQGYLSLAPYELRFAPTVPIVTLFSDMPTASQRLLLASTSTVYGEYRFGPRNGSTEGTYLWLEIPRFDATRWSEETYANINEPSHSFELELSIAGRWGAGVVPADVERACLVSVANWYRNPAEFATASMMGESVSEQFEQGQAAEASLPIAVRGLLAPYKRR